MATVKTLVCLANSRKNAGRCVAGMVDEGSKQWIRPVSARPNREVSEDERQYADSSDPRVLDIIAVPLLRPQARSYHSENWLLDPHYYWVKTGRAEWDTLLTLEQHPKTLWTNGYSTFHGNNNRVLMEQAHTLRDSLKLIRVDCVTLQVHTPGAAFGDTRTVVDAHFCHAGCTYILRLTDPEYERTYLTKQEGTYKLSESFLTVSLGEPHEGYAYKLVAAIIERAKI
ncbi:dual OB domain-containing protein [Streptomyces platensis]|uniref:dual OB domain-containing protein n=1 Tax=Streptomyces platensis TaxID=58346 RepID=UPI0037A25914